MFKNISLRSVISFFLILSIFVLKLEASTKNSETFKDYLDQIEFITGRSIPNEERNIVNKYYDSSKYNPTPLSSDELDIITLDFNNRKSQLIQEWETQTFETWPVYTKDTRCIIEGTCISYRKEGDKYDAHHIIPKSHRGPNEWCNLFPLDTREHNLIHGKSINKSKSLYCIKYTYNISYPKCKLPEAYCCTLFPNSCGKRN